MRKLQVDRRVQGGRGAPRALDRMLDRPPMPRATPIDQFLHPIIRKSLSEASVRPWVVQGRASRGTAAGIGLLELLGGIISVMQGQIALLRLHGIPRSLAIARLDWIAHIFGTSCSACPWNCRSPL